MTIIAAIRVYFVGANHYSPLHFTTRTKRQLRAGYINRPGRSPQCVILCGVRDVRDYRIHSDKEKAIITGNSAFNIKAKSLRLGDFTRIKIETLYGQHTLETGQAFTPSKR